MNPPHLPPKNNPAEYNRMWWRLKLLFSITAISLVVGASGASIMLGWIWPRFAEGDTWIASYTLQGISRSQLELRVRTEVGERIFALYKGSASVGGTNYLNKKIGDGIMLSSDGWLAVYQPHYDGVYKNIFVTGQNGNVYQVENALWDKYTGILYIKIPNEQFKVFGFEEENYNPDEIFVWHNDNWYRTQALYPVLGYKMPHIDTAPVAAYSLDGNFVAGNAAINSQGRFAGFVSENNTLVPSYYITRFLSKILSGQPVAYPSLGVEGWFSEEQNIFVPVDGENKVGKKIQGFLVTGSVAANSFRKGDILIEVNGKIVTHDDLWYTISDKESVSVKILRNGKEQIVTAKVQLVK